MGVFNCLWKVQQHEVAVVSRSSSLMTRSSANDWHWNILPPKWAPLPDQQIKQTLQYHPILRWTALGDTTVWSRSWVTLEGVEWFPGIGTSAPVRFFSSPANEWELINHHLALHKFRLICCGVHGSRTHAACGHSSVKRATVGGGSFYLQSLSILCIMESNCVQER